MDSRIEGMDSRIEGMDNRIEGMDSEIKGMRKEIQEVKGRVILIEEEHGKKLDLLFDGYKQNSEKLDRIEKEVTWDEEIIFRKVR